MEKLNLFNKFLNTTVYCLEQKSIRIIWYYNQLEECYEDLKKSLGKSIPFQRGVPELSENLDEVNFSYNNVIFLDDLMAEATDSPVVVDCLPRVVVRYIMSLTLDSIY